MSVTYTGIPGSPPLAYCTIGTHYNHMDINENNQTKRLPKQYNTTQCDSAKTVIFQEKNEVPQVGLKPTKFCILGRCSTIDVHVGVKHSLYSESLTIRTKEKCPTLYLVRCPDLRG